MRPPAPLLRIPPLHRLTICVAAAFGMTAPPVLAAPPAVVNCDDHGAGSLRSSVLNAATTDTIDLSALNCGTITLTTGAIVVKQDDLTISGPDARITITGKDSLGSIYPDRIFYHQGGGTLTLNHLNIRYGAPIEVAMLPVSGGCIESNGSVSLLQASVDHCSVHGYTIRGGGIATLHDLSLRSTTLSNNGLYCLEGLCFASGGGAYVYGQLTAKYSTIANNYSGYRAAGLAVRGGSIEGSTISGNHALVRIGGLQVVSPSTADYMTIADSTISGNSATFTAGIYSFQSIALQNSTVAFNSSDKGLTLDYAAAGLAVNTASAPLTVTLQSSLLANNIYTSGGVAEDDFSVIIDNQNQVTIEGGDNLIRVSAVGGAPAITGPCAFLGPLRDNGGPTSTHALSSNSPAIDAGDDLAGLPFDQRGSARTSPMGGATDIGAYEVDQADIVFNTGFDGCP